MINLTFAWQGPSSVNTDHSFKIEMIDLAFDIMTNYSVIIPQIEGEEGRCLPFNLTVTAQHIRDLVLKSYFQIDCPDKNIKIQGKLRCPLIVPELLESGQTYRLVVTSEEGFPYGELVKKGTVPGLREERPDLNGDEMQLYQFFRPLFKKKLRRTALEFMTMMMAHAPIIPTWVNPDPAKLDPGSSALAKAFKRMDRTALNDLVERFPELSVRDAAQAIGKVGIMNMVQETIESHLIAPYCKEVSDCIKCLCEELNSAFFKDNDPILSS